MKKKVGVLVITVLLLLTACGHKASGTVVDVGQFRCQDSIQSVFDVLGEGNEKTSMDRLTYEYEKLNLWGFEGTAHFRVRDDGDTISQFYCSLTLSDSEFQNILTQFENKYGSYTVKEIGSETVYKWDLDEDEYGYNNVNIQKKSEKGKYQIFFQDDWSIIKDEVYFEEREKENSGENDREVIKTESYDYGNEETMTASLSQSNDDGEYHLTIYLNIPEKGRAGYVYTVLTSSLKDSSGAQQLNPVLMLICGTDMISPLMSYNIENGEPISSTDWLVDALSDNSFDTDDAKELIDSIIADLNKFLKS